MLKVKAFHYCKEQTSRLSVSSLKQQNQQPIKDQSRASLIGIIHSRDVAYLLIILPLFLGLKPSCLITLDPRQPCDAACSAPSSECSTQM